MMSREEDLEKSDKSEHWLDSSTVSTNSKRSSTTEADFAIADKESKQVFLLKLLVIAVLFVAAAVISAVVYFLTTKAEEDEFKAHFQGGAEKIVFSFERIFLEKFGAVGSLCLAVTAAGKTAHVADLGKGDSWPFVTMDSFHERAASARILSKVLHMSVVPLVDEGTRDAWEDYSVENSDWYAEGFTYQQALLENGFRLDGSQVRALKQALDARHRKLGDSDVDTDEEKIANITSEEENFDLFVPFIYEYNDYWEIVPPSSQNVPYAPVWQSAPVTSLDGINLNIRSLEQGRGVDDARTRGEVSLRGFVTASPGNTSSSDMFSSWYSELLSTMAGKPTEYMGDPLGECAYPIFSDFEGDRRVVAVMNFQFSWRSYFEDILPEDARSFVVVLNNECDGSFTYKIDGSDVEVIGEGDLHSTEFDNMEMSFYLQDGFTIQDGSKTGVKLYQRGCAYSLHIYPSKEMESSYTTNMPILITLCILGVFLIAAGSFFVYDRLVENRQNVVVSTAKQSTDILGNLFPEAIRDRLMNTDHANLLSPNQRLKSYLNGDSDAAGEAKPIADLFPHTTVMFADLSGFTAWSSTRDPSKVFTLLQTVYREFDKIARRRKVFKVETIGDCYVAVTGLPNPQSNHAVIMCRFAWECLQKLESVLKKLEVTLGPDTNDLGMRFGIHSGAVTAGVLRGDRARFQLFGDTVNTAARLEQTGVPGKIQVSHATAALLQNAGKPNWLQTRHDAVNAKGKGVLNTFFVDPSLSERENSDRALGLDDSAVTRTKKEAGKEDRLVSWMTDVLLGHLKQIVVRRKTLQGVEVKPLMKESPSFLCRMKGRQIPLDEVVEHIKLPDFDHKAVSKEDPDSVVIPDVVVQQLRSHVKAISERYRKNPFHNFEHACHVSMSATKLLGRIVAPEIDLSALKGEDAHGAVASRLHDYTHGINSDPVTLFGIVYSALIHDVDHYGVGNAQTIKENEALGSKYNGKSVAEQNSFDIAWNLLCSEDLKELRAYLFNGDESEMLRLRQVVVNVVLATDIFDKELNDLRKKRWLKAFEESADGINNNLRGTIVLEHIMQASDVSHTMQHWHVYRKWNRNLFLEMYSAYKAGRMGVDPSTFWYKGEIGFFDNYIIPLAKKLEDCGVFGVSSDECLTYALQNRAEWEARGESIVEELLAEVGVRSEPPGIDV